MSTPLDRVKRFLQAHTWARCVATVLFVASIPLIIVGVALAMCFLGPYDTITKWARDK